jgi:hypothetical protein
MESSVSTDSPEAARKFVNGVLRLLGVAGGIALGFVLFSLLGAGTASAEEQPSQSQEGSAHHTDGLLEGLTSHLADDVVTPATKLVDHVADTTQAVADNTGLPVRPLLAPVVKTAHATTSTVDDTVQSVTHQVVQPVLGVVTTTVSTVTKPLGAITDPVLEPVVGTSAGTPRADVPAPKAKHASKHASPKAEPSQAPHPVAYRAERHDRATMSSDTAKRPVATSPVRTPRAPLAPSTPDGVPGMMTHSASSGSGGGSASGVLEAQPSLFGGLPSWRAPPATVLAPAWCDYFGHNHPS